MDSDADRAAQDELDRQERARLVEDRKNALPCPMVCDDGLYPGKALTVRCIGPLRCIEEFKGCFWRRFHQIPAHQQCKNCDVDLDD